MRLNSDGAGRQTLVYLIPQPFPLTMSSAIFRGLGSALRLTPIYLHFSVIYLTLMGATFPQRGITMQPSYEMVSVCEFEPVSVQTGVF